MCCFLLRLAIVLLECLGTTEALFTTDRHQSNPFRTRRRFDRAKETIASAVSWNDLESMLGDAFTAANPVSIDSVLDPTPPKLSSSHPTLFRERHGWCPYSERVWLALELLGVEYDTIRIDNTEGPRPSYFAGQTPQVQWQSESEVVGGSTSRRQSESQDLVSELDRRYNHYGWMSNDRHVQHVMDQFTKIFPARARPSSRAAFLFQYSGEPLWRSVFEATLLGIDALLSQSSGPFFCGSDFTAADMSYLPFLERYRYQLPCLHEGLEPFDAAKYPSLYQWYVAVDQIPEYACRVKGDAQSWARVLTMHGYGNAGVQAETTGRLEAVVTHPSHLETVDANLWKKYAKSRPHVASTPHAQAALVMTRNRDAIVADAAKRLAKDPSWVDESLRQLSHRLLVVGVNDNEARDTKTHKTASPPSGNTAADDDVARLARFLSDRMCVPRDIGAMPAACIREIGMRA
jgi:glutathione S-transferase